MIFEMEDIDTTVLNDLPLNDTDYDYDYVDSINQFDWNELVPTTIVYATTLILGISGNLLIIITISKYRRMKSITNTFLASLASADLLLVLVCTPVKLAKLFSYTWDIGWTMCKLIHYAQNVSAICSVFTLTAMSVERYYAIVHPMKAKYVCTIRQARKIIISTWVSSFLLAIPILFLQVHLEVGERKKGYWCITNYEWALAWKMHEVYMLIIVLVIPVCVMTVTYSAICREICKVAQRRYHMTSAKGNLTFESFPLSSKKTTKIKTKTTKVRLDEENVTLKQQSTSYKSEKQERQRTRKMVEPNEIDDYGDHSLNEELFTDYLSYERRPHTVIKMLVAVVIIFVLCWGPLLILNVLMAFGVVSTLTPGPVKYIKTVFHLMAYFNSCVNPVVYGFMSKNFRESFSKALCCRKSNVRRQLSVSHTRTTSLRTYIN